LPSFRKRHKNYTSARVTTLGRNLRSLGLLPAEYTSKVLRNPTKNQRDRIVKTARRFSGPANRPADFTTHRVTPATARKLRAGGYAVKQKRTVIERFGAEVVRITRRGIEREYAHGIKRTHLLAGGNIFARAEKFFAERKPGEYLMLSVNGKHEFGTRFRSMAEFEKYADDFINEMHTKGFENVEDHLYIVEHKT